MRVVAGSARGRRLIAPAGTNTRPTTDRVREAMFNALGSLGAVERARVLDAFAGSGALGIEALSRGAARCTFVERDRAARDVITANLERAGLADLATVVAGDLTAHLQHRARHDLYDLVLLDPPHETDSWPDLLTVVRAHMTDGAVVVTESDRAVVPADDDPSWLVLRTKRYGGTVVQVLKHRPHVPG